MIESRYHSFLRVFSLTIALVLLFDGGFFSPITKQLSDNAINYLASVGTSVSASVAPTELNQITAELARREQQLSMRESDLAAREIDARDFSTSQEKDYSIFILSVILFILTTLIVLNYILDWVRVRKVYTEKIA